MQCNHAPTHPSTRDTSHKVKGIRPWNSVKFPCMNLCTPAMDILRRGANAEERDHIDRKHPTIRSCTLTYAFVECTTGPLAHRQSGPCRSGVLKRAQVYWYCVEFSCSKILCTGGGRYAASIAFRAWAVRFRAAVFILPVITCSAKYCARKWSLSLGCWYRP